MSTELHWSEWALAQSMQNIWVEAISWLPCMGMVMVGREVVLTMCLIVQKQICSPSYGAGSLSPLFSSILLTRIHFFFLKSWHSLAQICPFILDLVVCTEAKSSYIGLHPNMGLCSWLLWVDPHINIYFWPGSKGQLYGWADSHCLRISWMNSHFGYCCTLTG